MHNQPLIGQLTIGSQFESISHWLIEVITGVGVAKSYFQLPLDLRILAANSDASD